MHHNCRAMPEKLEHVDDAPHMWAWRSCSHEFGTCRGDVMIKRLTSDK